MKKYVFMALALLSLGFSSCSKDDDGNQPPTGGTTTNKEDNTIGGTSTADPGANLDGTPGDVDKSPRTETFTFASCPITCQN